MEIKDEIIKQLIASGEIKVSFSDEQLAYNMLVKTCYVTLQKIVEIVRDHSLDDFNCMLQISDLLHSIGISPNRCD